MRCGVAGIGTSGGRSRQLREGVYRFGFNGQEKDDEIYGATGTSYDFGSRMLDPRVGRWTSLDPHARTYPSMSPYSAFGNSPLILVDKDGEDIWVYLTNSKGERSGKPVIHIKSDEFVREVNIPILPNSEPPKGYDPLISTFVFDIRPYEHAANNAMNNVDAVMIDFSAGFAFGGGVAGGFSAVYLNKGEDQGFHFYRNFGARIGLDIGIGAAIGEIDFNEGNTGNIPLDRETFEGWSQGLNIGVGPIYGTDVNAYVGSETCGPTEDCEPLYNGKLLGGAAAPTGVKAGVSYGFTKAKLMESFESNPTPTAPAATTTTP